jgi:hypothetical protein
LFLRVLPFQPAAHWYTCDSVPDLSTQRILLAVFWISFRRYCIYFGSYLCSANAN